MESSWLRFFQIPFQEPVISVLCHYVFYIYDGKYIAWKLNDLSILLLRWGEVEEMKQHSHIQRWKMPTDYGSVVRWKKPGHRGTNILLVLSED